MVMRYTCPWCSYPARLRGELKDGSQKVIECQQVYCKKVTMLRDVTAEWQARIKQTSPQGTSNG